MKCSVTLSENARKHTLAEVLKSMNKTTSSTEANFAKKGAFTEKLHLVRPKNNEMRITG